MVGHSHPWRMIQNQSRMSWLMVVTTKRKTLMREIRRRVDNASLILGGNNATTGWDEKGPMEAPVPLWMEDTQQTGSDPEAEVWIGFGGDRKPNDCEDKEREDLNTIRIS